MTDKEVVKSLDNAWIALVRQYDNYPDVGEVKSEVEENHRQKQITIDDWIAMLQKRI